MSVAAGKICIIYVSFTPHKNGPLSATLVITDKSPGSPQTIPLSGTGFGPIVSFSPTSLTFPATTVGKSAKLSLTLTNTGNAALSKAGSGTFVSIGGPNMPSFTQTDTCGASVAAGGKCAITVTFTPKRTGALTADVEVTDNAPPSPQLVKLTGSGK
jgi:hypothetical protein